MRSTPARIALITTLVLCISLLHYLTPLHLHYLHDIFQRFYYIPIILSALWFGFRGGLAAALAVSIIYTPHILFQWGDHVSMEIEKYLEIVLYNIVGGITGLLAQREKERTTELQETAKGLEESFLKLREQSEHILSVEEKLRQTEKLSTLGEMSAVLAHEIRNPLGSIRGTAEILKDDFPPGSPKHEFIEIQIRETERLNNVVEDFLRMARQQPLDIKVCSISEELRTIIRLAENQAKAAGVKILMDFPVEDVWIKGDGEKLRQAFLNLIINAIQATPAGGSVNVELANNGSAPEIVFSDSGNGISEEALERIFEPFYTTKSDGTGLGLAITKKIIEGHGGSIDVRSEAGRGTKVSVRIPA